MRKRRLLWQLYPSYLLITLVSLAVVACTPRGVAAVLHRTDRRRPEIAGVAGRGQFRPLLAAKKIDRDGIDTCARNSGDRRTRG